jgi:hypothetical protein
MHYTENDTKERMRREVVILSDDNASHQGQERGKREESFDEDEHGEEQDEEQESNAPWLVITTGKILTEGSLPYH